MWVLGDNILNIVIDHLNSSADWEALHTQMDGHGAKRSKHIIGENERVLAGEQLLAAGKLAEFGKLMFGSHEVSINIVQNVHTRASGLLSSKHTICQERARFCQASRAVFIYNTNPLIH